MEMLECCFQGINLIIINNNNNEKKGKIRNRQRNSLVSKTQRE